MRFFAQMNMRLQQFMSGRYGFDTLSRDMFILWLITGILNVFIRSSVFMLLALVIPILAIVRMLSQNINKRSLENRKYLAFRKKAISFFKVQYRRVKERKTHRYYKCKNCRAYLRVRRHEGVHMVRCPKCGKEFQVKIR